MLCSSAEGFQAVLSTLGEAGINFRKFFFGHLGVLIFANLALLKILRELIFANCA